MQPLQCNSISNRVARFSWDSLGVVPVDDANCVFTFVVVKQPGTSAEAFEADVAQVERDLLTLQELLESEAERIELANGAVAGLEDMLAGRVMLR